MEEKKPTLVDNDRLTVNFALNHEHIGEQPRTIEVRYSDLLETVEEPYTRRQQANTGWQSLDLGWVEEVGSIVIENSAGGYSPVNISEEQKKEISKKVLEVGISSCSLPLFAIPPQRYFFGSPIHPDKLVVRCPAGKCEYRITVIPR